MDGYEAGLPLVGAEPVCLVTAKPGPPSAWPMASIHWTGGPGRSLFQRLFWTTYLPTTAESYCPHISARAGLAAPTATSSAAPPMAQIGCFIVLLMCEVFGKDAGWRWTAASPYNLIYPIFLFARQGGHGWRQAAKRGHPQTDTFWLVWSWSKAARSVNGRARWWMSV